MTRSFEPGKSALRGPMPGSRQLPIPTRRRLFELSHDPGMSLHRIAREIGVSYPTISSAINGDYLRSRSWDMIMRYLGEKVSDD